MRMYFDDLVDKGLVIKKKHPTLDLYLYKYHNKVFYDNLWNVDSRLLECRGIVLDGKGNVIQRPFRKIFNYGENKAGFNYQEKEDTGVEDTGVIAVYKYNGFMAAGTKYKDEILITTTGSFDSSFVEMAKKEILRKVQFFTEDQTRLFEICLPEDPHIVHEDFGAHHIGTIEKETGKIYDVPFNSPNLFRKDPESDMNNFVQKLRGHTNEGFVIYEYDNTIPLAHQTVYNPLFKVKTNHYLSKKFIMRGKSKIFHKNVKKIVDEEFYTVVDYLRSMYTEEQWNALDEQERRKQIEEYFKDVKRVTYM